MLQEKDRSSFHVPFTFYIKWFIAASSPDSCFRHGKTPHRQSLTALCILPAFVPVKVSPIQNFGLSWSSLSSLPLFLESSIHPRHMSLSASHTFPLVSGSSNFSDLTCRCHGCTKKNCVGPGESQEIAEQTGPA